MPLEGPLDLAEVEGFLEGSMYSQNLDLYMEDFFLSGEAGGLWSGKLVVGIARNSSTVLKPPTPFFAVTGCCLPGDLFFSLDLVLVRLEPATVGFDWFGGG